MLQAPNFLKPWQYIYRREPVFAGSVLLGLFLLFISFVLYYILPLFGYIFVGIILLIIGILKIEYLFYALVAVSFFHAWDLDIGSIPFLTSFNPSNITLNAPVADFFAVLIFVSLFFAWLFKIRRINFSRLKKVWKVFLVYAIFLLVSWFSSFSAYDGLVLESKEYLFRPLIFVFIVYLILPILIIENKKTFMNVLYMWFGVGLLIAFYGFLSLFLDPSVGWTRVHPFLLGKSFAPLGINHNGIAEALVTIIPIGFYLWTTQKKKWILIATIFILLMALGTLSRAAWVSLFMAFFIFIYFYREKIKIFLPNNFLSLIFIVAVILLPIVWYMSVFLNSNVVKSSNDARIEMSKISWFYIQDRPLLGHGPGTFIYLLADTEIFRSDFGDPLDSHGIVQKILIEEGFIGLVFFVIFVYIILRYLLQALNMAEKEENKYLLLTLFIIVISSFTFQLFNTSYFKAVLWLPLGISVTITVFYLSSNLYEKNK